MGTASVYPNRAKVVCRFRHSPPVGPATKNEQFMSYYKCEYLHPKEVIRHFPHAVERTYSHGQIIVYYGDAPRHVMFIKSGAVKLYDTDSEGNEKIMHIGGEGSIFPLFYSFEDKISVDAFYASLTKTELLLVPITDFQRKLKTDAPYAFEILRWYASELDHSMLRLKSMEKSNAKQKIAQALTYLCEQHADKI